MYSAHMLDTWSNMRESNEHAAHLRIRMAMLDVSIQEVCQLVGRNRITVSRWRKGHTPIPAAAARTLHTAGLIDAEVLAQIEGAS